MPMRRRDRPSLPGGSCARAALSFPMSFGSYILDSPSLDRPFGIGQKLVPALRPSPAGRPCDPTLLLGNGKGVARPFLGGTCGLLGESCGHLELPRREAHQALEVVTELTLI